MNLSTACSTVAVGFALGASTIAGAETIVEIAPESTVLVINVADASKSWDRFQNSPLWRLWMSPEMREQRDKLIESFGQGLDDMAEELEIDRESLKPPTGPVGAALCTALDEETGFAMPAVVMLADYGEHADGMNEVITAMIEKGEDEGAFEYEIDEIAGRDVWAITMLDREADMDGDGGMGQMGRAGMPDFEDIVKDAMKTMHLVRDENTFIVSSHRPYLAYALDVIDGRADLDALSDRDDYQGMTAGLEGYDATAVLMFRDLGPLVSAADPMGMTMMIAPMLQQFIGDVKGFSMGFRFSDDESILAESRLLAYMPNGRVGLTALLDTETEREDLPDFVGLNASTFSRVNFEFQGLPPIVRQAMMMFPMAAPQEGPQPHEIVERFTAAMGQEMYMMEVIERPLKAGSVGNLIIVECPDMQEMETALASVGMLEPRDFAGGRIFDIDMSGMMMGGPGMGGMQMEPQGLGLAGGYMFSGPMPAVEQALRSLAEDEHTTLASDQMFQQAVRFLPTDPVVAWGYQDVVASAEAQAMMAQLQYEQMVEMFAEEDPEWADEMEALREDDPMAMLAEFDWAMLRDYIGPQVWDLRATEKGFEMRSWMLKAVDVDADE